MIGMAIQACKKMFLFYTTESNPTLIHNYLPPANNDC
jgi:hypothetical protein